MSDEISKTGAVLITLVIVIVLGGLTTLTMWGCPQWGVYRQGLEGEGELRRAEQNRQIAIQEAEAKKASASLLAEAEVERAKGVAAANTIIGDSLEGNDAYLRYLWIDQLGSNGQDVIYVPTEAGLPILEAGKRKEKVTE